MVVPLGDLRAKNFDTVLGNLWHVLNPLMLVGVYYVMFGLILNTNRGVDNFITFLAIGVFSYHYTQRSMTMGARSIVTNETLIRAIQFPRAILPISSVIEQTLAFLPAALVMLGVALATGEAPGAAWLLLVPLFAFQGLFNLGGAFVLARTSTHFRDIENVLPHVFRVVFYMSGILYSVDRFIDNATVARLFLLNPMYVYVSIARGLVQGTDVSAGMVLSASCWTVGLLVAGFVYFRAGEEGYGRG